MRNVALLLPTIVLIPLAIAAEELAKHEAPAFELALKPREFQFPADFGSHSTFKTEWWYLTGALRCASGELFGYQATWFRTALTPSPQPQRKSALAARDLIVFHGSHVDVARKSFVFEEKSARAVSSWAGAEEGNLHVWLLDDRLKQEPDGSWHLKFSIKGHRFELRLEHTRKPMLHGEIPGLSLKGSAPGQASYYVSCSRLKTTGTLQRASGGEPITLTGYSWFDQEFGSNQLSENQIGWDWFSVALDDGTDLMIYGIRLDDGTLEPNSSGTLRFADGRRQHLSREQFSWEVLERWKSPHSSASYPARWRLKIPERELTLEVKPMLADQELRAEGATATTYWEGLCLFEGKHGNKAVKGYGYVELVGYAQRFRHKL